MTNLKKFLENQGGTIEERFQEIISVFLVDSSEVEKKYVLGAVLTCYLQRELAKQATGFSEINHDGFVCFRGIPISVSI